MSVHVRAATVDDHSAILALVPRLAATGTPSGRDAGQVRAADMAAVGEALHANDGRCAFFIADIDDAIGGFVHVRRVHDYYTQADIAHVSDIVVAPEAEGRGIGNALMAAAEAWANAQGFALIQLYVLPENAPARRLYERVGYAPEWLKYVKPLG
ncbi:GNAT family N-acetyltransferase [Lysobacter claricitrinus]|uniref:GNAT family N-acetyltransferase n=1 Tax=Lysobacter claricitrinus TaxID=3367728 RepID=UPI0037DBE817